MKKSKLDEFHYHEACDRTYLILDMIDSMLINHPVYYKNKKLRKKLKKTQDILWQLYQKIGNIEYFKFNKIKDENSKNQ